MITIEYKRIELDFCPHCRGTWFDKGELALLLDAEPEGHDAVFIDEIIGQPSATGAVTGEKKRRCPICGRKMAKTRVGGDDGILLDACVRGEGLWFDGGEIDRLVALANSRPDRPGQRNQVFNFMQEVFGASAK